MMEYYYTRELNGEEVSVGNVCETDDDCKLFTEITKGFDEYAFNRCPNEQNNVHTIEVIAMAIRYCIAPRNYQLLGSLIKDGNKKGDN